MKHGPRCPSGPRYHKAEVWWSDAEVAKIRRFAPLWGGLSDAACIREAALLAFEMHDQMTEEARARLLRLNPNLHVIWPGDLG